MYDNTIKVYKNAATKISLEVRRLDRKLLYITKEYRFYLNIMTQDGEDFLIRKEMNVDDYTNGRLSTTIEAIDLDPVMCARYNYSVSFIDENSNEIVLYTDNNSNASSQVIVMDRAMPVVRPPYVQYKFTRIRTPLDPAQVLLETMHSYISSRLPVTKDNHTLLLKMENFTGRVFLQTTRSEDPDDSTDWNDHDELIFIENSDDMLLTDLDFPTIKYIRIKIVDDRLNHGKFIELQFS